MSGAAYLSASAALRSGIGLAHVFTHEDNRIIIQSQLPEAILSTYGDGNFADFSPALASALDEADVAVVGCGLGRSATAAALLEQVLNDESGKTMVLDADALNILAENPHLWSARRLADTQRHTTVITPHPAEFARLTDASVSDILRELPVRAARFARERGVFVVLKDAHTVIAAPDGTCFINPYANSGMAKGGSGDVLSGIIGAMLMDVSKNDGLTDTDVASAIASAVLLHSLAGAKAREDLGEVSMLPTDLIKCISHVTRNFCDTTAKIEYV